MHPESRCSDLRHVIPLGAPRDAKGAFRRCPYRTDDARAPSFELSVSRTFRSETRSTLAVKFW